jgi:ABC-type polysaccharide/polyol phosphate transport system ATPase subunit
MYLRASHVSLHFRLDGQPGIDFDDDPEALPHRRLGGTLETRGGRKVVQALHDICLDLRQGDRLAIVGHNGSGKSTLLKALAGIYYPQHGRIEREGPVTGIFNIALGFRQEASGYRNIMLKGLIAGKSRAEIERVIPEIAAFTELGPYLHMPLRTYSQGMAMRLAFAIATAYSSDILLMDEWIGAGDARFNEKIITRMNSFVESAHILVLASHSTPLLRRIANRAIWLEAGRIREAGSVEELVDRYEADARTNARAARAKRPLRKEDISLSVTPGELPDFKPGSKGIVGEVTWDASQSGADIVEIYVVGNTGQESLCFQGHSAGHHLTGPWIKPGVVFRLKDALSGELLAATTVLPVPEGISIPVPAHASHLTVTPSQLPDFKPGDRGIAGEVAWDASQSDADIIELFTVDSDGKERLCFQGNRTGSYTTGPWIKPGLEFRLRDAVSGHLLAARTVLPAPEEIPIPAPINAPRITVTPSQLPDFKPGGKGIVGEVAWDAGDSGALMVEVYAADVDGKESLCFYGEGAGWGETGPWIKPGVNFLLRNADSGELLATTTILPLPEAGSAARRSGPARLNVTLREPKPGTRSVAGEIAWDAGDSGARMVEVYVADSDGKQTLCFTGRGIGQGTTKPWIKPGMSFLLKDAETDAILATVAVPVLPESPEFALSRHPPRLTISPPELPDFKRGDPGVVGEVAWDAGDSGASRLEIHVASPDGSESLCFSGRDIGRGKTGPWLKPGLEFRLKDADTKALLATIKVG